MPARRVAGLPEMTAKQALEAAALQSPGGGFRLDNWRQRPFRAPHHTASSVAVVGGGSSPRPAEISLAHHRVLLLDELPEFARAVLEVLSGKITIYRAARQSDFPAQFQLIAAMNPCPCRYLGHPAGRCTSDQVARSRGRISGPLLDRIDIEIEVPALPQAEMMAEAAREASATFRARAVAG